MFKSMVTALGAQNATETTKTQVAESTIPQGVKKLVGVASQVSSAGLTTLEDLTHLIELESDDMAPWNGTQQFLGFGVNTLVTSGVAALNPFLHPCDIPVTPGAHIKGSITFNKALTINPSCRIQYVFE